MSSSKFVVYRVSSLNGLKTYRVYKCLHTFGPLGYPFSRVGASRIVSEYNGNRCNCLFTYGFEPATDSNCRFI